MTVHDPAPPSPPTPPTSRSTIEQKTSYLDILAIFHYVYGGIGLFFILFAGAIMGGVFSMPEIQHEMRAEAGCLPMIVVGFFIGLGALYCVANLLAGYWLQKRRQRIVVMVVSGLNCANFPLGTVLGIFTIGLLAQPEVKALFDGPRG